MAETPRLRRAYGPLVDAVGRMPAKVHTKLLIAFLGTSILFVASGSSGSGAQAVERPVGTLGGLQERNFAYGQLQRDAAYVRALMAGERREILLQGLARSAGEQSRAEGCRDRQRHSERRGSDRSGHGR
jgi:hypothetical protein